MVLNEQPDWVIPADIPFADLKGRDLEECVYWLLDAMGAKDLEWRTGGEGGGAADGGRDLEAIFYVPTPDREMEPQRWWIECKGRNKTVEKSAVIDAVNNATSQNDLAVLLIVTNTTFSNPTRDWVREWQTHTQRPRVKLWDRDSLERLLSQQPSVVLRLFAEALSLEGRLVAACERFWNKLEYVPIGQLEEFWRSRQTLDTGPRERLALLVNEFAHGDIVARPWAAEADPQTLLDTFAIGTVNLPYFVLRGQSAGIDDKPIGRALAHLLMVSLRYVSAKKLTPKLLEWIGNRDGNQIPENILEFLLMPLLDQVSSEIQDVCSADCKRFSAIHRRALYETEDPIPSYWQRFDKAGRPREEKETRYVTLEKLSEPCKVGFPVDEDQQCPLFQIRPSMKNVEEFLATVERIIEFRLGEASTASDRDKR